MDVKDTFFSKKKTITCKGKLLDFSEPKVMGILNVTPDSFYNGGLYKNTKEFLKKVECMINDGAAIIDIGAYSSKPGALKVTEKEELKRLVKAVEPIRKRFPEIIISIDTFRSVVIQIMVNDFDVDIVNDITAGEGDNKMFDTIKKLNIPYIIMHMQGVPETMQINPYYENLVKEIIKFLSNKIIMLKKNGVKDIIIDPGFGFGKTISHNYQLLKQLDVFGIFELPILIGVSRKSMIYKFLDITPEEALSGTTVINTVGLLKGASILRVHDVKQAVETIKLVNYFNSIA